MWEMYKYLLTYIVSCDIKSHSAHSIYIYLYCGLTNDNKTSIHINSISQNTNNTAEQIMKQTRRATG